LAVIIKALQLGVLAQGVKKVSEQHEMPLNGTLFGGKKGARRGATQHREKSNATWGVGNRGTLR